MKKVIFENRSMKIEAEIASALSGKNVMQYVKIRQYYKGNLEEEVALYEEEFDKIAEMFKQENQKGEKKS